MPAMRVLKTKDCGLEHAANEAAKVLQGGGVVAYPTETFYALGAKFDMEDPISRIFRLKGREPDKAVSLIIGSSEDLYILTRGVGGAAGDLMHRHWPGPLTILFQAVEGLLGSVCAEGKVAVRVPGESFALVLALLAGFPITATSTNPSGMPPASDMDTVMRYCGGAIDLAVDGGTTPGGLPSTVVDATGDALTVLRHGAVRIGDQ
jgi:L-threonylcarbamoyladenylate synthase